MTADATIHTMGPTTGKVSRARGPVLARPVRRHRTERAGSEAGLPCVSSSPEHCADPPAWKSALTPVAELSRSPDGWGVAVERFGAVGADGGCCAVGVEGELPAPPVDRYEVVEAAQKSCLPSSDAAAA